MDENVNKRKFRDDDDDDDDNKDMQKSDNFLFTFVKPSILLSRPKKKSKKTSITLSKAEIREIIFASLDVEFEQFSHLQKFFRDTDVDYERRKSKRGEFDWFFYPKFKLQDHDISVIIRLRMRKTQLNVKLSGTFNMRCHTVVQCIDILHEYVTEIIFKRRIFDFINIYFEVSQNQPYRYVEVTTELPTFLLKEHIDIIATRFNHADDWISIPSFLFDKPHEICFLKGPFILHVNVKVHERDPDIVDRVIQLPPHSNFRPGKELTDNTVAALLKYSMDKWDDVLENEDHMVTYIGKTNDDGCLVDDKGGEVMAKHFGEFCSKPSFEKTSNVYVTFDVICTENFDFDMVK